MPPSYPTDDPESAREQVKHLSLGSRKNLCINPKVTKLNSATAINERCLEMQQSGIETPLKLSNTKHADLFREIRGDQMRILARKR